MGKKTKPKNKIPSKRWTMYKIEGGKLSKGSTCPKCGDGVFLAQHKNRSYCGTCKYTTFNDKK